MDPGRPSVIVITSRIVVKSISAPPPTAAITALILVAASRIFAVQGSGNVISWGLDVIPHFAPETTFRAISAGDVGGGGLEGHTLAVKRDGTVLAWGDNNFGQVNTPVGLSSIVAVSAGQYHSLALKQDGTVLAGGGTSLEGEGI